MDSKAIREAINEGRAIYIPEMAHMLGLSVGHMYAAVREGEVAAVKVGRRRKITATTARRLLGLEAA